MSENVYNSQSEKPSKKLNEDNSLILHFQLLLVFLWKGYMAVSKTKITLESCFPAELFMVLHCQEETPWCSNFWSTGISTSLPIYSKVLFLLVFIIQHARAETLKSPHRLSKTASGCSFLLSVGKKLQKCMVIILHYDLGPGCIKHLKVSGSFCSNSLNSEGFPALDRKSVV